MMQWNRWSKDLHVRSRSPLNLRSISKEYGDAISALDDFRFDVGHAMADHTKISWKDLFAGLLLDPDVERKRLAAMVTEHEFVEIAAEIERVVESPKRSGRRIPDALRLPINSKQNKAAYDRVKQIRVQAASCLIASIGAIAADREDGELAVTGAQWLNDSNHYMWPVALQCPTCGEMRKGMAGINDAGSHTYSSHNTVKHRMEKCAACGHSDQLACTCKHCSSHIRDLANQFKSVAQLALRTLPDEVATHDIVTRMGGKQVTDLEMHRDWVLNQNDLPASLRAVLALHPQDANDFERCVAAYCDKYRQKPEDLIRKALELHMLYETYSVNDKSKMRITMELEARSDDGKSFRGRISNEQVRHVLQHIVETPAEGLVSGFSGYRSYMVDPEFVWPNEPTKSISLYGALTDISLDIAIETKRVLNPNFFRASDPVAPAPANPACASPLFRSKVEARAFARLATQGRIVVPNRQLWQLIDLAKIDHHFEPQDRSYLQRCEVDFAIYDSEGNLLEVEELQRGSHHERGKYIQRDALKRKALALAGIPFRESF